MRLIIAFVMTLLCAAAPAAAAKFDMTFRAGEGQELRMQDGVGAVDSHAEKTSVRLVQQDAAIKKRGAIQLQVMNHGDKAFNVGPENVRAVLNDGSPIEIITYERLRKEEKKRQMWAAVAAGLAAAGNNINASNAGYSSGVGTYRTTTYGSYGSARTYGTARWSSYNSGVAYAAQSQANAENRAMFANLADQNAARMDALRENMRTSTVDPDDFFGGQIVFELPKAARNGKKPIPVTFIVTIDGEEHRIAGTLTPR
ncbi:hypothetical protein [Sphingosinicella sp. BN140058]|uniref:hypothetical protein n=1 Tax=Sphingosinicella sp. BN140058 TaxID=1892855 RepID=UPI0010111663|nr:hypothetical protein [Sphingosinicella sp. BN140058]QAY80327.1 hypothetical protein ETR14_27170 [Sphingosinicella sp. BN140058]